MPANYVEILVKARDAGAKPELTDILARLEELKHMVAEARATVDTAEGAAALDRLMARLIAIDGRVSSPRITVAGAVRAEGDIHAVEGALDGLIAKEAEAAAASDAAGSKIADASARIAFAADRAGVVAAAGMERYRRSVENLASAISVAEEAIAKEQGEGAGAAPALNAITGAAAAGAGAWGLWGAAAALAGRRVTLFGGALNSFVPAWLAVPAAWHVALPIAADLITVLAGAAVALGAFGAAAAPAAQDIVSHMQAIMTVSTATGQSIYPLTGAFAKMADAVKPQVWQLFGDALTIVNHDAGEFGKIATGAGQVLDQLGARFALAVTHGNGFSRFLKDAVPSLAGLGDIAGNIGGALGNLARSLPGYAMDLLNVADAGSKVLEWATGVATPVLKAGLAFHGAFLYIGLGATLASSAVRGSLTILGNWAEKAGMAVLATDRFGAAGVKAGSALLGFSGAAADAAALPWGWIAIAAAGIGFLAYKMLTAKDATQQWLGTLQDMIGSAGAANGLIQVQSAQLQVATKLSSAYATLASTQKAAAAAGMAGMGGLGKMSSAAPLGAVTAAQQQVADLTSGQRQLNDETTLYLYRLGRLGTLFGSTAAAQGLLTAAGVKMSEMLDKSKWPLILQQVTAVDDAYQAMGQRAGVLGADLNALTIAGSDQVQAMSKLNQAWSTVIGIVSGGQTAFIGFEQQLQQAATAAQVAGASMNGLNAPSLALRAAWQQSYTGAANLISALRMMSSISPGGFPSITQAVKDSLIQLGRLGGQSAATRAEMISLAQEVNPNIRNFTQLTQWLGHTRDAGASLDKILAQSGVNLKNLEADASQLSGTIQNAVVSQFSAAKMAANGTNAAIAALANAIGKGGATASQVHSDMVTLYDDLVKDGLGAQAAADLVSTLSGQLFRVPKSTHTNIIVNGVTAASQAVQNFLALLSRVSGTHTAYVQAIPVGGGTYLTGGGGVPGGGTAPSGGTHGPQQPQQMQVTLRHEGSGPMADLVRALLPGLRAEVRVIGGAGPNSVQRALGQVA